MGKALEILKDGGEVDYVGATNVELIGPGEAAGTYREYDVKDSAWEDGQVPLIERGNGPVSAPRARSETTLAELPTLEGTNGSANLLARFGDMIVADSVSQAFWRLPRC